MRAKFSLGYQDLRINPSKVLPNVNEPVDVTQAGEVLKRLNQEGILESVPRGGKSIVGGEKGDDVEKTTQIPRGEKSKQWVHRV